MLQPLVTNVVGAAGRTPRTVSVSSVSRRRAAVSYTTKYSHVGGSRERGEHAENRVDVVVIGAALGSGCVEGRARLGTRNAEGALPRYIIISWLIAY